MLEEVNRINLLYDIYSPLLTERQQDVMHLYFSDNYSLAEIAAEFGTSRQAVHDLIQRTLSSIEKFEEKLGLYRLFNDQQELLTAAEGLLGSSKLGSNEIDQLRNIIEELRHNTEK